MNETEKVVLSSTLTEASWQNSRIVDAEAADVVKQLRGEDGGDIVVLASASVIKALLDADEIDRLSITLAPELVGGGARLFEDGLPASSWQLADSTPTESGAICLLFDRIRS